MSDLPEGYSVRCAPGLMAYEMGRPFKGQTIFSSHRYDSREDAVSAAHAHHRRISIIRERATKAFVENNRGRRCEMGECRNQAVAYRHFPGANSWAGYVCQDHCNH